ncbi:hypothetical protein C882_0764 [Caenispirillum salinarum AK4]|uniref:DUF2076 domain-containing protein n=1 Tax=Caenispirillum salinarum AK4 TaxID=1238182 RepID=K9HDH5_9PROT|nr:DUF2076 family protein [Caenispirillum salinarum]EKV28553.1 hypothetical protein C882_0764 [Caenispirillum salinarum AK4]
MDAQDRALIDGVFDKVRQAEEQGGSRDADAEAAIAAHVAEQPHAPYYMAQGLVMLEESLKVAEERIAQLEDELCHRPAGAGGGLLGGLFGGGASGGRGTVPAARPATESSPILARAARPGHGGFMGGAGSTLMAVAGGVMLGNLLGAAMMPDMAGAEDAAAGEEEMAGMEEDLGGAEDMDFEF